MAMGLGRSLLLPRLQKPRRKKNKMPLAMVEDGTFWRIVQAMTQSVAHLHLHGIVHGDLKPSSWLWDARQ